jgi:hypothetical protein
MNKRAVGILGAKLDKISSVFVLLAICAIINLFGRDAFSQERGIRRHAPPPEAYEACEGKSVGDEAEFINPRGYTVTGICEEEGDQLVLRPDNPKKRSGGRRHGPPPEAYEVCEGKSIGDEAEFVNRRGYTVTGTCEEEGDQLVLRPDNPKGRFCDREMNNND